MSRSYNANRPQPRHQVKLNRVTITSEFQTRVMVQEREAVLDSDPTFAVNVRALMSQPLPEWSKANVFKTLVMRALGRAGYPLHLSRQMANATAS